MIQKVEPFKIFDNLYYVGLEWVSCYLVVTDEGLVLLDSLYGEFVDHAIDGVLKLGFDPTELHYVLVTHGHYDHAGGAALLQERFGARVGMTEADWRLLESSADDDLRVPKRDLVLADGDTLELGHTVLRFYVTPGHTEGVLSTELIVLDGGKEHRAFQFGGVGLNFTGVERTLAYLESVSRVRELAQKPGWPIEVNVANHPSVGALFDRRDRLASRQAGDPHAFVAADDFLAWLDELETNAKEKLEQERELATKSSV